MTPNEIAIKAFADAFEPPLRYGRTARVNNVPFADAWTCTAWDEARGIGVTAVAFEGQLYAYLEAKGRCTAAASAGHAIATAMALVPPKRAV